MSKIIKPEAIIFDWDNTLVDSWPVILEALRETFIIMGHEPWPDEEAKKRVHRSLRDAFPPLFGHRWKEASNIYLENFLKYHLEKLTILPKADEVLKLLDNTDIYLAIVSNKTGKHLRTEVSHIGWDPYFQKVVGALDADADKPSPAPVYMALEGSGISPGEHVWFIGDSVTDVECAISSGCKPIYFGDKTLEHEEAFTIKHVKDHDDLINLLGKVL